MPDKKDESATELRTFANLKEVGSTTGTDSSRAPQASTVGELIAVGDVLLAAEPLEVIRAGERFFFRYPDSAFHEEVLESEFQAFRAKNDYVAVLRRGRDILKLNPDNVAVLAESALLIANQGDVSRFTEAMGYAARAIECANHLPRPERMTRLEFARWRSDALSSAHAAQGVLKLRNKEVARALSELQESIRLHSEPGGVLYLRLGEAPGKPPTRAGPPGICPRGCARPGSGGRRGSPASADPTASPTTLVSGFIRPGSGPGKDGQSSRRCGSV